MKANYKFTVHFHQYQNPLGLQCNRCLSRGQRACCDNPERNASCGNDPCETGFRFMLRPYGAPGETAPTRNEDFPQDYITPDNISVRSTEFHHRFLGLPNPFTLTSTDQWNVRYCHCICLHVHVGWPDQLATCS